MARTAGVETDREIASADAAALFDSMGTLGVEEEFFVVDGAGRPTAGTGPLIHESRSPAGLADGLDHEQFKCIVETQTPCADDLAGLRRAFESTRDALLEHAAEHDLGVAAAGLHPAADHGDLEPVEDERYLAIREDLAYPQWRNTTAGLHVHVGVDDADKATWIANEIRWYLPVMLALSANSPYIADRDTGMASARALLFESLPNTGIPTAFDSFADYYQFERRMVGSDSVGDRGALWFDVRPHTGHGTVEIRIPDAQADSDRALAFVEYAHALVVDLAERYADGEPACDARREVVDQNKWRAMRHGHDASFVRQSGDGVVDLRELVDRECDRLGVSDIRDLYEAESGAERQRRVREAQGLDAVCEALRIESA